MAVVNISGNQIFYYLIVIAQGHAGVSDAVHHLRVVQWHGKDDLPVTAGRDVGGNHGLLLPVHFAEDPFDAIRLSLPPALGDVLIRLIEEIEIAVLPRLLLAQEILPGRHIRRRMGVGEKGLVSAKDIPIPLDEELEGLPHLPISGLDILHAFFIDLLFDVSFVHADATPHQRRSHRRRGDAFYHLAHENLLCNVVDLVISEQ